MHMHTCTDITTSNKAGHQNIAQLSGLKPAMFCAGCCSMQCNCAEGLHFSAFHFFCECYIYMYMQVQLEETAQELGAKVVDSYSLKGIHVMDII